MKNLRLTLVVIMVCGLAACNMSNKSSLDVGKIRVKEQYVTKSYDLYRFDNSLAKMIANEMIAQGENKVVLNISYLNGDADNKNLMMQEGKLIKNKFKEYGISDARLEAVPVDDNKNTGKLVIYYKSKVALAPAGCTDMVGINGAVDSETAEEYSVGCNSKMVFSKMIADPNDLLGETRYGEVDSRRAGATVEKYKTGEPNGDIQGVSASDIGN